MKKSFKTGNENKSSTKKIAYEKVWQEKIIQTRSSGRMKRYWIITLMWGHEKNSKSR